MKFTILPRASSITKERWGRQFVVVGRNYLESIWRRSEDSESLEDPSARRRRIIHVIDKYDMVPNEDGTYDFAVTECYMWICSTLPKPEITRYIERLESALSKGGWQQQNGHYERGELRFSYTTIDRHPEDTKAGRDFGEEYQTIECTLISRDFPPARLAVESPWAVYNSGRRQPGARTAKPQLVTDMHDIIQYLPAQVELGGGASLELGIPPLNYFHTVYNVYAPDDRRFAYGDTDSLLDELLPDPETFYTTKVALPYLRALQAEPNNFYTLLAELVQNDLVVGPIITNNFDGICSLVGLQEYYVRRYDESHIVPEMDFPEAAKSLWVVGSHADRRRVQQAAKQRGLKVIYIDPESYVDHFGNHIDYPLEKIEDDDLLIQLAASEFATQLRAALASTGKLQP